MNPNSQSHPLLVGGRRLRRGVVQQAVVEPMPHDPSVSRYTLLIQKMHLTGWIAQATSPTSQGRTKGTVILLSQKLQNKIQSNQVLILKARA